MELRTYLRFPRVVVGVREVPHPHQTPLTRSRELFNQLNYLIGGVALIGVPWLCFHVMLPVTAFGCLVI